MDLELFFHFSFPANCNEKHVASIWDYTISKHYKIDIDLDNTVYYGNIIILISQTTKADQDGKSHPKLHNKALTELGLNSGQSEGQKMYSHNQLFNQGLNVSSLY